MGDHVVVVESVIEVARELEEADLQIDDQESGVVDVKTLEWDSCRARVNCCRDNPGGWENSQSASTSVAALTAVARRPAKVLNFIFLRKLGSLLIW